MSTWDVQIGDLISRTALHERFGGSSGRGISAPADSSNLSDIMLFWDPVAGADYGYDDGWSADGDRLFFSGTGVRGDQFFHGNLHENGRVRDHIANGDRVRLLRYRGKNEVEYAARLRLRDWRWRDGRDQLDHIRKMIEFEFDVLESRPRSADEPVHAETPVGPSATAIPDLPPKPRRTTVEALRSKQFERLLQARRQIDRRAEAELVHDFKDWLASVGRDSTGMDIPYRPEGRPLRADLYVYDPDMLVEAKSSASRESVRTALGQLYDYIRYFDPPPRRAVLLPTSPAQDMVSLLHDHGAHLYWRDGTEFVQQAPPIEL